MKAEDITTKVKDEDETTEAEGRTWPPTPTPRMLGRSSWRWSLHRRRPASSPSFHRLARLFSPGRFPLLVRFPFREAATGSGRHRQPSPHRGREAQALAPGQAILHIWKICLTLPHGECGQNRLNSVGQFCSSATKMTLHSSSLLRQGDPWTPRRLRENSGPTASPPEFPLLLRPKGKPSGLPRLRRKTPGPHPGFFVEPEIPTTRSCKTNILWPPAYKSST